MMPHHDIRKDEVKESSEKKGIVLIGALESIDEEPARFTRSKKTPALKQQPRPTRMDE